MRQHQVVVVVVTDVRGAHADTAAVGAAVAADHVVGQLQSLDVVVHVDAAALGDQCTGGTVGRLDPAGDRVDVAREVRLCPAGDVEAVDARGVGRGHQVRPSRVVEHRDHGGVRHRRVARVVQAAQQGEPVGAAGVVGVERRTVDDRARHVRAALEPAWADALDAHLVVHDHVLRVLTQRVVGGLRVGPDHDQPERLGGGRPGSLERGLDRSERLARADLGEPWPPRGPSVVGGVCVVQHLDRQGVVRREAGIRPGDAQGVRPGIEVAGHREGDLVVRPGLGWPCSRR